MALYLQVLRKGLLHQVQQAGFHLATQVHPERYGQMSALERTELHRRLGVLVKRCGSLLTIEQLCVLGQQMQQEQRRHRQERQASILAALESTDGAADEELPEGSVQLGMDLPLSAELFSEGMAGLAGLVGSGAHSSQAGPGEHSVPFTTGLEGLFPPGAMAEEMELEQGLGESDGEDDEHNQDHGAFGSEGSNAGYVDHRRFELEDSSAGGASEDAAGAEEPEGTEEDDLDEGSWDPGAGIWSANAATDRSGPSHSGSDRNPELKLLQSMFSLAADTMGRLPQEERSELDRPGDGETSRLENQLADHPLLPSDPMQLLGWWQALDFALQRRLRNLSHALNVDLLRLRLTRSLMPVNLLEAVLQGQIDPKPAPANLLRLQLPFASAVGGMQLETLGLLLRCGDLEFDMPPLRTCRKRLEQQRQELRKMAQRHRHWQRRLHALEAEQQWLQDDGQVNPPQP
ncbi:MAG: hypothetical protein WBM08_05125 [Prochlorococcaceae cyanobacterium]